MRAQSYPLSPISLPETPRCGRQRNRQKLPSMTLDEKFTTRRDFAGATGTPDILMDVYDVIQRQRLKLRLGAEVRYYKVCFPSAGPTDWFHPAKSPVFLQGA